MVRPRHLVCLAQVLESPIKKKRGVAAIAVRDQKNQKVA